MALRCLHRPSLQRDEVQLCECRWRVRVQRRMRVQRRRVLMRKVQWFQDSSEHEDRGDVRMARDAVVLLVWRWLV